MWLPYRNVLRYFHLVARWVFVVDARYRIKRRTFIYNVVGTIWVYFQISQQGKGGPARS